MANIAEMVKELQQERDRLDQAIGASASLAGASKTSSVRGGAGGPRRTMSAAARRKVSLSFLGSRQHFDGRAARAVQRIGRGDPPESAQTQLHHDRTVQMLSLCSTPRDSAKPSRMTRK